MKVCVKCGREFKDDHSYSNPFIEIGKIYLESAGTVSIDDICPECREDLGIMSLLGFGE
jgi:hypothetical protein